MNTDLEVDRLLRLPQQIFNVIRNTFINPQHFLKSITKT